MLMPESLPQCSDGIGLVWSGFWILKTSLRVFFFYHAVNARYHWFTRIRIVTSLVCFMIMFE